MQSNIPRDALSDFATSGQVCKLHRVTSSAIQLRPSPSPKHLSCCRIGSLPVGLKALLLRSRSYDTPTTFCDLCSTNQSSMLVTATQDESVFIKHDQIDDFQKKSTRLFKHAKLSSELASATELEELLVYFTILRRSTSALARAKHTSNRRWFHKRPWFYGPKHYPMPPYHALHRT